MFLGRCLQPAGRPSEQLRPPEQKPQSCSHGFCHQQEKPTWATLLPEGHLVEEHLTALKTEPGSKALLTDHRGLPELKLQINPPWLPKLFLAVALPSPSPHHHLPELI